MKDETRITLRLPSDLMDRIKAQAERKHRSANGEIVRSLEKLFPNLIKLDWDDFPVPLGSAGKDDLIND